MSLSNKRKGYWKPLRKDSIPYRSWKRYRSSSVRGMKVRDSIINHIPLEGVMPITYKYTHTTNAALSHELSVPNTLDMSEYNTNMESNGFEIAMDAMDDMVITANGRVAVELKTHSWSDILPCDSCGSLLELVSIDVGYSCTNEKCALHLTEVECA
jgi:hypothetical protein